MQFSGNVLIVEQDHIKRQALETIFTFLGAATQTGEPEDCLSYLDSSSEQIDACIVGTIGPTEQKHTIPKLLSKYTRTAFIVFKDDFITSGKEGGNYIGRLSSDPSYDEVVQLLHYCQSFKSMNRYAGKLDSRRGTLIKRLIGRSESIGVVRRLIEQVAPTDANVLILGESGTGKEVVARAIHDLSNRSKRPFVPVNCGAIPGELLESELFGHEKGAFTGAFAMREGRFELAEGGTLFLDEIGDMPFQMQVKLLRVLQERTFTRVGSNKIINANVRVIAATHQNLEQMVQEKKFREDLFYRLNVFPIETPSLRERSDDVPLLIQELVNRHGKEQHTTIRFTQRAMLTLMQHPWKGNVRELSNLVERLLILHPNEVIDTEDLPGKYRGIPLIDDPVAEREALLEAFSNVDEFIDDTSHSQHSINTNTPPHQQFDFDEQDYIKHNFNEQNPQPHNLSVPNTIGGLPPLDQDTLKALAQAGDIISQIDLKDINKIIKEQGEPNTNTINVANANLEDKNELHNNLESNLESDNLKQALNKAQKNQVKDEALKDSTNTNDSKNKSKRKNAMPNLPIISGEEDMAQAFVPRLSSDGVNLKDMITEIEISMIKQALEQTNGVVAKAAEALSLRRTTLIEKMKKYGLTAQQ